jgi:hypothetical protein
LEKVIVLELVMLRQEEMQFEMELLVIDEAAPLRTFKNWIDEVPG